MFELEAKSKKEADLFMYGSISQWSKVNAQELAAALKLAEKEGYSKVNLRINSPGGSIFEGIAMMSVIERSDMIIDGYVDGIAASMASVLLTKCNKVYISKAGRLMTHQGSGGVYGSAKQISNYAKLLESLNETLAEAYAAKTGKEAKWIIDNWMKEGSDTWFTAKEALKDKLVDEVIDNGVKSPEKAEFDLIEMAAYYEAELKDNQTKEKMNKEELAKSLGLDAKASEEEINAAIKALQDKANKAGEGGEGGSGEGATASAPATASAGEGENAKASALVIKMAEKAGFITEKNKESFTKLAALDPGAAMDLIPEAANGNATAHASIAELIEEVKKGSKTPGATTEKKWEDYTPEDLAKMEEEKPEEFKALFEKTYNKKLK